MNIFKCTSNEGVQGAFCWEKGEGDFWGIRVEQFTIRDIDNLEGNPFIIQVKESDKEVRILYQDNNGETHLTGKGITEGMVKELYDVYKKTVVSSSNISPIYENEGRALQQWIKRIRD